MNDYRWVTHRNPDTALAQSADAAAVMLPHDLLADHPGPWREEWAKLVPYRVAYRRICHGPHVEDTTPGSSEHTEAMMIRHFGAETNEVAWTSASGRKLYWWDLTKLDPRVVAAANVAWMQQGVLPYVDAVMFDYLEKSRLEWQIKMIQEFKRFAPNTHVITNGRPDTPYGRFLESMGRHWWPNSFVDVLNESTLMNNHLVVLDTYRKPELLELAQTTERLWCGTAYVCRGRYRESGLEVAPGVKGP